MAEAQPASASSAWNATGLAFWRAALGAAKNQACNQLTWVVCLPGTGRASS